MEEQPRIRTGIFLRRRHSLKNNMLHSVVSSITPMFSVGKKMALGRRPDKAVFKRLQQPNAIPVREATAKVFLLGALTEFIETLSEEIKDSIAARRKATSKNTFFCSGNADFCCTFCMIPNPPDESIAMSRGRK